MDSLNQSLIEKLEKARMHVSEMMPEDHRMAMSNFNSGLKEAIAIIRQHEASIEPSKSATSDHVNDKDVVEIGSEIPDNEQYLVCVDGDVKCSYVVNGIEGIEQAYIEHVIGSVEGNEEEWKMVQADIHGNDEWVFANDGTRLSIGWHFEDGGLSATRIMGPCRPTEPVMSKPDAALALSKAILDAHAKWQEQYIGVGHVY